MARKINKVILMRAEFVETLIIDEPSEVMAFLEQHNIPVAAIREIRNAAHGQMIDCSPLMARKWLAT